VEPGGVAIKNLNFLYFSPVNAASGWYWLAQLTPGLGA